MMKDAAAAMEVTVRTWFQAVQVDKYSFHRLAPWKNTGFRTATLMDCMAAMPLAGGRRPSAVITKDEKAKEPADQAAPSADRNVNTNSRRSIR